MLFIILLGVISKFAVVSADCNIGIVNQNNTDWTNFTGIWYWLYHVPHKYDDNLDCPMSSIHSVTKTTGRVTTYVYVKSTQTYDRMVGFVDWNTNGYFDLIFPTPSGDTKCSANKSCTKHPYYARMWTERLHAVSVDHGRYCILKYCCPTLDTPCVYIGFRTPNPDEGTLSDVKKDLKENGLDIKQLVKWDNNHCKHIQSP